MNTTTLHHFHIPVLGLGYTIDTPAKVARFGISSVISITDDVVIESMRAHYSKLLDHPYEPISERSEDHRARRITGYLDLIHEMVERQMTTLRALPFFEDNELSKYFELLPDDVPVKQLYLKMMDGEPVDQDYLRSQLVPGAIDVNIMCKVDNLRTDANGDLLPEKYSDAIAALRGFAASKLSSSVVLSAGYNPRLYNYVEQLSDFLPDEEGKLKKKIILKVSDYRSALIQGKLFAKKGIWISEFRIESGLNCGGHAFATDGLLLGPILEEFRNKRADLAAELFALCSAVKKYPVQPPQLITVQGGIGTAHEQEFLLEYYAMDATGWGSPFLLVPEATNVDEETLQQLATAKQEDYYVSDASPLGVPFNNLRNTSSERQREMRIAKNRPGSPCYKKFLVTDTQFTKTPICTASREYQHLKIKELEAQNLSGEEYKEAFEKIVVKDCLCEGLTTSVLINNELPLNHNLSAVTICPGPNLAYFSGTFSLTEMVNHIYGRVNILNKLYRPNMFINELHLYIDYFKKKLATSSSLTAQQAKSLQTFKKNLLSGIEYYKQLAEQFKKESNEYIAQMRAELDNAVITLNLPSLNPCPTV